MGILEQYKRKCKQLNHYDEQYEGSSKKSYGFHISAIPKERKSSHKR